MRHLVVIATALLGAPHVAAAGGHSHGGGHGGGHGHAGGGSRGLSRGLGHGGGHIGGCAEVSSVVGYQRCAGFGAWARVAPGLSVEFGLASHRFVGDRVDASGTFMEDADTFGYRFVDPGNRATRTLAPQLRTALRLPGPLYIANELEFGGVIAAGVRAQIDGAPAGPVSSAYGAARGVVGLSALLEPITLSGEVAAGIRFVGYKIKDEAATSIQHRGELQVRLRLDVWLTPHLTIGAMVGTSLDHRGDTLTALSIGGHVRAFGGEL